MQFKQAGKFIINKLSKELPANLSYHSVYHTQDVYKAARLIGKQEGISACDMKLLLTAAWYHDSGFLKGPHGHEDESCLIATAALPGYGYSDIEIEKICGMILATKIPQEPKNYLEEILADADLDYLGRDDFFIIGQELFNEFLALGFINTEEEWNRLQVRFLESHHYFTKTSISLRQAKKELHLKAIKAKLK
jgi:uncharacterized protein